MTTDNYGFVQLPELKEYIHLNKGEGVHVYDIGSGVKPPDDNDVWEHGVYQVLFKGISTYPIQEKELKRVCNIFSKFILDPILATNKNLALRVYPCYKEVPGQLGIRMRLSIKGRLPDCVFLKSLDHKTKYYFNLTNNFQSNIYNDLGFYLSKVTEEHVTNLLFSSQEPKNDN